MRVVKTSRASALEVFSLFLNTITDEQIKYGIDTLAELVIRLKQLRCVYTRNCIEIFRLFMNKVGLNNENN